MGGNGAFALGASARGRFAGVSPICGWGDARVHASGLRDAPLWVAHGDNDVIIPADASLEMVTALRAAGNTRVVYRTFADAPAPEGGEDEIFGIMNLLDPALKVANSAVVLATTKCFLKLTAALPELQMQVFLRLKTPLPNWATRSEMGIQ
jgi:hypothetical protein